MEVNMELIGILGMVFIFLSYLQKRRDRLHMFATLGALLLGIYSYSLGDKIFLILNTVLGITNFVQLKKGV